MQKNKEKKIKQEPAKHSGGAVSQQHKKIERIRARASYIMFRELYGFLEKRPSITEVLRKFFNILNAKCSFGSRKNAEYAEESLDWVLKDKDG